MTTDCGPSCSATTVVLAVDPGTAKCGLAVVDRALGVHARRVVDAAGLPGAVCELLNTHAVTHVLVGDRTGSHRIGELLGELVGGRPVVRVDEHYSSVEARRRYFRDHPPCGLRRLLPVGLQVPPCPIDDYVAVILAERYFAGAGG